MLGTTSLDHLFKQHMRNTQKWGFHCELGGGAGPRTWAYWLLYWWAIFLFWTFPHESKIASIMLEKLSENLRLTTALAETRIVFSCKCGLINKEWEAEVDKGPSRGSWNRFHIPQLLKGLSAHQGLPRRCERDHGIKSKEMVLSGMI